MCLYPNEMHVAARVLKDGGTGKDILQMIHEGTLEEDMANMEKCRQNVWTSAHTVKKIFTGSCRLQRHGRDPRDSTAI